MHRDILLLTDYRNCFYCSTTRRAGVDLELLRGHLAAAGFILTIQAYADLDFRQTSFRDRWVLYQSSEDEDLHYKDYLEDQLLALQCAGARLIPRFACFRAHHNKVFMELLRDMHPIPALATVHARGFGTYEEFVRALPQLPPALVMKPAAGAGSAMVSLVRTLAEKKRAARRMSAAAYRGWVGLKDRLAGLVYHDYSPVSWYRRKFIAQDYIPNLAGDFKVLVFGEKYYVLQRENRPKDFRASGSGRFTWPEIPPLGVLQCAKAVYAAFDVPYISLDIAYDGTQYHVLEFQFLSFGTLTMQRSRFYFTEQAGTWNSVAETPVLEREIAASVVRHIEQQK